MSRTIIRAFNPRHYEWIDEANSALFEGFDQAFDILCRKRGPMFYGMLYTFSTKLDDFRTYRWRDRPEKVLIYSRQPSDSAPLLEEKRILVVQLMPDIEDITAIMEYAARMAMTRALEAAPLSKYTRVEIEIWKGRMSNLKKGEGEEIRTGCVNLG